MVPRSVMVEHCPINQRDSRNMYANNRCCKFLFFFFFSFFVFLDEVEKVTEWIKWKMAEIT